MAKPSHLERTSADPREPIIHSVVVQRIQQANDNVRLITLHKTYAGQSIKARTPLSPPQVSVSFELTSAPKQCSSSQASG